MATAAATASNFLSTTNLAGLLFLSRAVQAQPLAVRSRRSVTPPLLAAQPANNLLLYLVS
jgi:hypothetical protein